MDSDAFLSHPEVFHLIQKLKDSGIPEREYSDVIDADGYQYVDLVQGGGGVLGIAVMGYIHVLESMGIRFLGLAGTSVGAVNSTYMAALGDVSQPKAAPMIKAFVNEDLYDFVDGGSYARELIAAIIQRASGFHLAWRGMRALPTLMRSFGLNPGTAFYHWMQSRLDEIGVSTTAALMERFGQLPASLMIRPGVRRTLDGLRSRLVVVASDVTTESKVHFPEMADLYWENPNEVSPAQYVRASMSIPLFFEPYRILGIPQGVEAMERWARHVRYHGAVPEEVFFVDGGIMSNFPIGAFHQPSIVPRKPTFAVRLGMARNKYNRIGNMLDFGLAVFNAAKQVNDQDFITRNPDYQALVKQVDIGQHDWLDFSLTDEAKIDLFIRGAKAAAAFLKEFDWRQYKAMRGEEQKRWAYFKFF